MKCVPVYIALCLMASSCCFPETTNNPAQIPGKRELYLAKEISSRTIDHREQISICEIHNVPLIEEIVAASNITVEFEKKYEKTMLSRFPHLGFNFGIDTTKYTKVLINYCPRCREENNKYHDEAERRKAP